MCGYCTEEVALDILYDDVRGKLKTNNLGYLLRYFYLRETPDFIHSFDKIRRSLAQKKIPFFSGVPAEALLFRGLETLIKQGFESGNYKKLLKNSIYRDAITLLCSENMQKEFEALAKGYEIENLVQLYVTKTFFTAEGVQLLMTSSHILQSCRSLLKHYIAWWLDGQMPPVDLLASVEELGVLDEINKDHQDKTPSAIYGRTRKFFFESLIRSLYFSIIMIGDDPHDKVILRAIAKKKPSETPHISGEDLWLRRVAALKLYELEGFDTFSKYLTKRRSNLFFYINQLHSFSAEQKQIILDKVGSHYQLDLDESNSLDRMLNVLIEDLCGEYLPDPEKRLVVNVLT
ncbi:MAG: hypothetical protein WCP20_19010 [Desulfuromonadales bacterium]